MGASSSQVQMDEDNDATSTAAAPATETAKETAFENTITPKSIKKPPRTYSKRKRPASPETMARPLNSSTAQGSAKRPRAEKENGGEEQNTAALSGKENREPEQEEGEQQRGEPKSSLPPMKKLKVQELLITPPSPPPTQQQPANPKSYKKKVPEYDKIVPKKSQRTLEGRLSLPAQTFQPGHVNANNEKKTGWFSPEEINALEKYKSDFCKENMIDGDTFDQCIQASNKDRVELFKRSNLSHLTYVEFCNSIYLRLPHRDKRSIRRFMRRHFQAGHKPYHWTEADDDELQRLHQIHGPKWSVIAGEMERTQDDVVQRWKNKVEHRHTMRRGGWAREEVEKLIEVLEKSRGFLVTEKNLDVGRDIYEMDDKYVSWGAVSDFFGNTRSRQQCADKWRKIRQRVVEVRQKEGNENATYLDVYDFSAAPRLPYRWRSREELRTAEQEKPPKSAEYVRSDDEEEEEENNQGGKKEAETEAQQEGDRDGDSDSESNAASDDDNLSTLGHLPLQQSSNITNENNDNNNNNEREPDSDSDSHDDNDLPNNPEPSNKSPYNPAALKNILLPLLPSSSPSKKPKLSKAEKAEAKAARKAARKAERKAQRKAQRKAERKKARRAQKRAASIETSTGRSVSVKRESTQESSGSQV